MTKQKLTFNTIMEKIVIWSTVLFVVFMIFKKDIEKHNIRTEGNIKYNQYISNYIKNNPDMVALINKELNCYRGKVYAIEGCGAYVYNDSTLEQQVKLHEYNMGLKKIINDTEEKLKD